VRVSQKKARQKRLAAKIEQIRAYVYAEQYAIRALLKAVPREVICQRPPFASVGRCEIWPCADAAVVLIYPNDLDSIEVVVRESSSKKHDDFMGTAEVGTFFRENGSPVSWRPVVVLDDAENHMLDVTDVESSGSWGTVKPRYQRLMIFGWEASLPEPDDEALRVVQSDIAAQNLAAQQSLSRAETKERALNLSQTFRDLIETAHREEEVQRFLAENPELLYPDYIDCHPKLKLGEDLVTDYVVLVQSPSGPEYVFVEIERPNKPVFTEKGWFSHQFTQAKDQLLQWSAWITINHDYLERKLPNLGKPAFHLVIGRGNEMTSQHRATIQAEFSGTNRRFGTYDDVVERFNTIVERLF
jgi:hypothetical protein